MKNHKGVVLHKTQSSWAVEHFKPCGVALAVPSCQLYLLPLQCIQCLWAYSTNQVCVMICCPKKVFCKNLWPQDCLSCWEGKVWVGMGKEVNSPLPYTIAWGKGKRKVPCFWGCDFYDYSLSTFSSSGGLHSWCSCGHCFTFWAEEGAQFILSWILNCLSHM